MFVTRSTQSIGVKNLINVFDKVFNSLLQWESVMKRDSRENASLKDKGQGISGSLHGWH